MIFHSKKNKALIYNIYLRMKLYKNMQERIHFVFKDFFLQNSIWVSCLYKDVRFYKN